MRYLLNILILLSLICLSQCGLFDRYTGKKFELSPAKALRLKNATERCSIQIKPCTPHEGSRIDGTCNNHKYPVRGSARGAYLRLLKPDYGTNGDIRMSRHKQPLPSARKVRTELQSTGRVEDKIKFNMAAVHMLEFVHRDISVMNGPLDYLRRRPYCCTAKGETDPKCIPIKVPDDDPYLKVTDIRCLNFSRAETFEDDGCTSSLYPEQINFQTPVLDLSTIYGVDDESHEKIRTHKHGLVVLEKRLNRYVPANINENSNPLSPTDIANIKGSLLVSMKNGLREKISATTNDTKNVTSDILTNVLTNMLPTLPSSLSDSLVNIIPNITANITQKMEMTKEMLDKMTKDTLTDVLATLITNSMISEIPMMVQSSVGRNESVCFGNNNTETVCYQFGFPEVGNFDLRTTTFTIFFMREHNRIARELHNINRCWHDDRLFKVARQINVATAANIFMYELLPVLLGVRNMVNYGLLSEKVEHVTAYDVDAVPLVYMEYEIAVRYFRTLLDGRVKTYKEDYHYKDEYSYSNLIYRSGILEKGNIFEELNRGTFLQYAAKIDDIQDPEISETFYGTKLQRAHDLPASDIQRGRDVGIRGYNDYRKACGMKAAVKFEDLLDVMEVEKVDALKRLYEDVDDIDLLAGIMSENEIQGIPIGPTLYCIMTKQWQLMRFADRFWFERGDQYHSFNLHQLSEIRKTNMARFACDNAEGIKFIQPQAFLNVRPGNMPIPCSHIEGGLDLTKWRDESCLRYQEVSQISDKGHGYKPPSAYYGADRNTYNAFFNDFLSQTPVAYRQY